MTPEEREKRQNALARHAARLERKYPSKKRPKTIDGYTARITSDEIEIGELKAQNQKFHDLDPEDRKQALEKVVSGYGIKKNQSKIKELTHRIVVFRGIIAKLLARTANFADSTVSVPVTPDSKSIVIPPSTAAMRESGPPFIGIIKHFLMGTQFFDLPRVRLYESGVMVMLTYNSHTPRYFKRMHPLRFQNAAKENDGRIVWVVAGGDSNREVRHYGIIKASGEFEATADCPNEVLQLLQKFESTPAVAVADFGSISGICATCGKMLKSGDHVPVCAGKFGIGW